MAKPARTFRNRALRNLGSGISSAATSSASLIGKAAAGVGKWMATSHISRHDPFSHMPTNGFLDSLRYIILITLAQIAGAVLGGILIFLFFAYGIPFLITGSFNP